MNSTYGKPIRLGYSQTGGEASLRIDELAGRLLILGGRANEMAAVLAYASREEGLRPLILDMDGYLTSQVSGYFSPFRLADVLYDLYKMDENAPRWHGELLSSAYTAALDLTFEEEAILDAAMQVLASQDNMASPPVVYDALSGVEGFRGFYVDKLKGRIGTLKSLDAADSASVASVLAHREGAIIDLSGSEMPRATELASALLIAKLIAVAGALPRKERPEFILLSSVHRIFRALPKSLHGNRLFTALLTSPLTSVLASNQSQALSPLIVQACPTKILSADAWNQIEKERRFRRSTYNPSIRGDRHAQPVPPPVLPNSFVLEEGYYGFVQPFVARTFEPKAVSGTLKSGTGAAENPEHPDDAKPQPPTNAPDSTLTKRVLQEVKAYESPSMPSLVSYLSGEFPKDAVHKTIDGLEKGGFVKLSPKQQKSGRTILSLELTEKGIELLGRLA
jgi:hypothetical protein